METKQAKACYFKFEPASAGFVPIDHDFESGATLHYFKSEPASAGFVP